MSIAILTQAYDEMRRLAIAGSGVAGGDFRLKKLLPALQQAGEKAPVFAKVAQAAQAVVDSDEKTASAALLDMATLVNAILYTQGETGLAGELQPVQTTDLGARQTQSSARVLKPLLEALSTTGSGRLELIKDAFDRGAFSDLRLVRPALAALDDPYPEIGDFIARKVLPLYGQAVLPQLRESYNRKGRGGHVLRLELMHELDPQGTREIVQQTLEDGSKELRVAAIACLGESGEDLAFLLEQSKSRAKDVRAAALKALSRLKAGDAVQAVKKLAAGGDLELVIEPLRDTENPELLQFVLTEAKQQLTQLLKLKDRKEQAAAVTRMRHWLSCLDGRDDPGTEELLLKCFDLANQLAAIKSEPSGSDINETVTCLMANSSQSAREQLIAMQESLSGPMLSHAFFAARRTLTPQQLFEMFSPCLLAVPDKKSKKYAQAFGRLEAIRNGLVYYAGDSREDVQDNGVNQLDPRWLDVAVAGGHLDVVKRLARPGHAAANKFLSEQHAEHVKKHQYDVLETMVRVQHPDASDAVIRVLQDGSKSPMEGYLGYWIGRLLPDLPQDAAAKIEAVLPTLSDKLVDRLMEYVLALKNKPADASAS